MVLSYPGGRQLNEKVNTLLEKLQLCGCIKCLKETTQSTVSKVVEKKKE